MTVESWIEEFYPVPAWECSEGHEAAHGLRKWTGILKENLEKHRCKIEAPEITDGATSKKIFGMNGCALCLSFSCSSCPGYLANGYECFGDPSLSRQWIKALGGDPTELIQWLQKAKEYQDEDR